MESTDRRLRRTERRVEGQGRRIDQLVYGQRMSWFNSPLENRLPHPQYFLRSEVDGSDVPVEHECCCENSFWTSEVVWDEPDYSPFKRRVLT